MIPIVIADTSLSESTHNLDEMRYFTIRYKLSGKDREEGLGWATENWTAAKAYERLTELK